MRREYEGMTWQAVIGTVRHRYIRGTFGLVPAYRDTRLIYSEICKHNYAAQFFGINRAFLLLEKSVFCGNPGKVFPTRVQTSSWCFPFIAYVAAHLSV